MSALKTLSFATIVAEPSLSLMRLGLMISDDLYIFNVRKSLVHTGLFIFFNNRHSEIIQSAEQIKKTPDGVFLFN